MLKLLPVVQGSEGQMRPTACSPPLPVPLWPPLRAMALAAAGLPETITKIPLEEVNPALPYTLCVVNISSWLCIPLRLSLFLACEVLFLGTFDKLEMRHLPSTQLQ